MAGPSTEANDSQAQAKYWFVVAMGGVAAWIAVVVFFFLR